jgi:hypothetical protein
MLLVDGVYTLVAAPDGSGVLAGLWSGDPLVAMLASSALEAAP